LFIGLWGLVSHNVLDDPFILMGLGLIATVPTVASPNLSRINTTQVPLPPLMS
jgi:hypothetical protein